MKKSLSGIIRFSRVILTAVLFVSFHLSAIGQEQVKLKRISGPIEFDGIPDEQVWKELDLFNLTMHKPNFGSQPSEKSDVRLGYDNEYLWIGASLYMEDVSKIFATTKKRDEMVFDIDAFGVILDTYNDKENGLAFFTTPTGSRSDFAISNDASGGGGGPGSGPINNSWNTFWDVRTSHDDKGWYLEMRIPFSSLKFKPLNDKATMGLMIVRNISANNEKDTYPPIDPRFGRMASNKPSLAQEIVIEGARPQKPVYVSPYVIGGLSNDWSLNEAETEYVRKVSPDYNAGIDVKYNINSNLTLDITANTDFAQVEADDQQVNLTRYSLFFPEKRMFFQERSSLFDFSLGGRSDNLFYSRNIGIADREPVRIYGGGRLTGRIGRWDLGFLDMQTAEHMETAGENFGVLRMRRQVINQNSYVGGILTSRIGTDGRHNLGYGLDGIFRLYGDDYLNVKWSQTYDSELGNSMNSLDPSFILVKMERRSDEGFGYDLNYTYAGEQFKPGAGFLRREKVQGLGGELRYGWFPGENSKLFNYEVNVRGEWFSRLEDGNLESLRIEPGIQFNTKKQIRFSVGLEYMKEGVLEDFQLSDSITISAGTYSFTGIQCRFGNSESRMIALRGDINAGQFYDGNRIGIQLEPGLNLSSSLKLSASYEFNAIRFPGRVSNNMLNIHSTNIKALYMLSTKLSASILVQYVNTGGDLISNFRLRYNPREGNDFYLVYNDYRGRGNMYSSVEVPPFFNKTIMVKYTHTFIL